jgi:ketosteroid isomerase-like protein
MSVENVDLARQVCEAINRGDLDAASQYFDPEVEWTSPGPMPERRRHRAHGPEQVRKRLMEQLDPWDDYSLEPEELIDGGDRCLVAVRMFGRGKVSGAEVNTRFYTVFTVRSGRAIRVENFVDRESALEAAGLRE